MKHQSRSLQLISYDQSTSKFQLNEKALMFLQNLNKPLAITTISGSICSGKSYILNEVIGQQDFTVSSRSLPETKGIWISKTPILSLDEQYYHVFFDGEGLSSIDKDSDYDIKLLLLSMMISSTFIYNSFGAIEQSSLEVLRSSIGLKKHCTEWNKFPFTDLIWLARDFNLGLVDREGNKISQKSYLQSAFKQIEGDGAENHYAKNQTRKVLRETFTNKYCYTLPRPTINQAVLRNLPSNHKKIKPQFLSKIAEIRKDIICRSKPKQLNKLQITPSVFISMMRQLVKNINNIGGISTSAWSSISRQNNQKVYESCINKFNCKLSTLELSLPKNDLNQILNKLSQQIQKQYSLKTLSFDSSNDSFQDLKLKMQNEIEKMVDKNESLLKQNYLLELQQSWRSLSIPSQLECPLKLKQSLEFLLFKLNHKEQWIKYCQNLIDLICNLSSKLQYFNIQLQHHSLKQLKADYQLLKNINSDSLSNISILEQRIKTLDQNIQQSQKQKRSLRKELNSVKQCINQDKDSLESISKQNKQFRTLIKQLQFKVKSYEEQLNNKQLQTESQVKIFLQQKRVNEQQARFYQGQIKQLKQNIETIKSNNQRSNVGLLQNNQILKRLETIKNRDNQNRQREKEINKERQNKYEDQRRVKQLKDQVMLLESKTKKLESNVVELSQKIRREQQHNVNLRNQLNYQLEMNKQIEESKRSYEDMVDSLQRNLEVIHAAQQREKKMYEQSVLRLIQNVEKREEQYKRKSEMREKYSRHQY